MADVKLAAAPQPPAPVTDAAEAKLNADTLDALRAAWESGKPLVPIFLRYARQFIELKAPAHD